MPAGLSSENPVLVLQADEVNIAGIQKVGRSFVGWRVVLGYLEVHARRIAV
jgi:hypothetical protein